MADEQVFLDYVDALARRLTPLISVAYLRTLLDLSKQVNIDTLVRLLDDGDAAGVVERMLGVHAFTAASEPMQEALREVVAQAGALFYRDTPAAAPDVAKAIASVRFQSLNPVVVHAIEQYEGKVLREMADTMRATVRQAVEEGLRLGINPRAIATGLVDVIGLAPNQEQFIRNYRAELEALDPAALTRALTDGRYDQTVRKAIGDGRALTSAEVDKFVGAYRKNWLRSQAEATSRTVTINAMREAQILAWEQAIRVGKVNEDEIIETWITTLDGRERPAHHQMHGRQKRFRDLWNVPGAGPQRYPGETEWNCRCRSWISVRIRRASEMVA